MDEGDGLRKRFGKAHGIPESTRPSFDDEQDMHKNQEDDLKVKTGHSIGESGSTSRPQTVFGLGQHWLTRIVLLRYMAFIYLVAFTVALHQNRQLIGKNGLLPAENFLEKVKKRTDGMILQRLAYVPSLLWLFDYNVYLDLTLDCIAYAGIALSSFILFTGAANWPIMLTLWLLYHSLVSVGQRWYGFGFMGERVKRPPAFRDYFLHLLNPSWESQVLECGFLLIFMCPVWSLNAVAHRTPPSRLVVWGYRWLIFRIMLGAGLIKIRGDACWLDLTCMNYHYQTQPVPNPLSYYMHQSPEWWHKFETMVNHFVELPAPILLLSPWRWPCMIGGTIQIIFQVTLIMSGNLSFLNWLTIFPCLACYDDKAWACIFPESTKQKAFSAFMRQSQHHLGKQIRWMFHILIGILLAYLSIPVVQNLLSSRQAMNTSFDPLRLVNTYGAFGSITRTRTEVIFQGTYSTDPHSSSAIWIEYEFKCKPGNVTRRPCIISPYHYRLDWLMWFAAFQNYQSNPWIVHLAVKLLANDEAITSLMDYNPFYKQSPPRFIRAEHYKYVYTKIGSKDAAKGLWWKRKYIGSYFPPISLKTITPFLEQMDWQLPQLPPSSK